MYSNRNSEWTREGSEFPFQQLLRAQARGEQRCGTAVMIKGWRRVLPCLSQPFFQHHWSAEISHLHEGAFCLPELDADPQWDADHGGQCHHPPDAVAPVRVDVHVVVFQGLVLHQEKDEDSLEEAEILFKGIWEKSVYVTRIWPSV